MNQFSIALKLKLADCHLLSSIAKTAGKYWTAANFSGISAYSATSSRSRSPVKRAYNTKAEPLAPYSPMQFFLPAKVPVMVSSSVSSSATRSRQARFFIRMVSLSISRMAVACRLARARHIQVRAARSNSTHPRLPDDFRLPTSDFRLPTSDFRLGSLVGALDKPVALTRREARHRSYIAETSQQQRALIASSILRLRSSEYSGPIKPPSSMAREPRSLSNKAITAAHKSEQHGDHSAITLAHLWAH